MQGGPSTPLLVETYRTGMLLTVSMPVEPTQAQNSFTFYYSRFFRLYKKIPDREYGDHLRYIWFPIMKG